MSAELEKREERQEARDRRSCSPLVTRHGSLLSSLARTLRGKRGWRHIISASHSTWHSPRSGARSDSGRCAKREKDSAQESAGVTRRSSLLTASEGQAQVEFVLSILFVLLLIFGIFELIMLLYTYNVVADSAKEGVRYAIILGSDSTNGTTTSGSSNCSGSPTGVYGRVCSYAATCFHDISGMTVTVSYPDGGTSGNPVNAPPNRVQVQVSYPYKPLLNLGWPSVTVNAAAEGRIAF